MATEKKEKKTTGTKKTTGKKASKAKEQIEQLEKALRNVNETEVLDLMPEEVKADILENKEALENLENAEPVDFDGEVKKILENAEPSDEIKEQVEAFEAGKEEFNKTLDKEPEKAEETVMKELKRVQEIKKKVEEIQKNLRVQKTDPRLKNNDFTNWWNGSSSIY